MAQMLLAGSMAFAAAGCGIDSSATFNADGSVVVGLKFLFPKSLMTGTSAGTVSGFSPSAIASDNAKLQARYPGSKVERVTQGDESGAMVTIPFKTEKEAFAFLTQPSKLEPSSPPSSRLDLNLSDTGGMFASATHTRSGGTETYSFKTRPATQPSPSPGGQSLLTEDQVASIFTVTFSITVPKQITSAPGALFTLDRKTATWKLSWLHAETLTATTGGEDAGLVASVIPLQDFRLLIAIGFIALAAGLALGILLAWRGLVPRPSLPPPPPAV
jgi:hypothetical protein